MSSYVQQALIRGHQAALLARGRAMLASDGTNLDMLVEPAIPPIDQFDRPEKSRMEYLNL